MKILISIAVTIIATTTLPIVLDVLPTLLAILISLFFIILPNVGRNAIFGKAARERQKRNTVIATAIVMLLGFTVNVWWILFLATA